MTFDRPAPDAFELVVGRRWLDEAIRLQTPDARRWIEGYDPDVLRAHVDIVVSGRNTTAALPDEPILPLVRAWLDAVERLAAGRPRARVEFAESANELAIERDGEDIRLSLFELGAPGRFRLERVRVPATAFRAALCACVERLAGDAEAHGLDPAPALRALSDRFARVVLPATDPVTATRDVQVVTESEAGLCLVSALQPATSGMTTALTLADLDRHLLLATGTLRLGRAGGHMLDLPGRPLRLLEGIVDALVSLTRRRGRDVGTVDLVALDSGTLRLRSVADDTVRVFTGESPVSAAFDAGRDELVRVVAEHCEGVVRALAGLNPVLGAHPILVDMAASAAAIRRSTWDSPAFVAPAARRVGERPATPVGLPDLGGYAFPAHAIRRMRYERSWTLELPDVDARRTQAVLDALFVVPHGLGTAVIHGTTGRIAADVPRRSDERHLLAGAALYAIGPARVVRHSVRDGAQAWARTTAGWDPTLPVVAGPWLVAYASGDHRVWTHRAVDGARAWVARPLPAAPAGLAVGERLVVAVGSGRLWALDAADGRFRWACAVPYERISVRVVGHDCVVVADDPLADAVFLGVIDGRTGQWLRRHELAADVRAVHWDVRRGAAVLTSDGRESRVTVLDVRAGTDWSAPVPWNGSGAIATCAWTSDMVLAGVSDRVLGVRPDGVSWSLGRRDDPLTIARHASASGLAFLLADHGVRVVETTRGRELHRIPAFWERLSGLVADDRGHLVAIEHVPGRGTVVHGVGAVGVIAALDGGRAAG